MSKRTPGLPQRPRGYWPTPREAVVPLIPYLPRGARYGEPCAGNGALIEHLRDLWPGGYCSWASDLEPQAPGKDNCCWIRFDAQNRHPATVRQRL